VTESQSPAEALESVSGPEISSWPDSVVLIWLLRITSVVVIAVVVSTAHARIDRNDVAVTADAIAAGHPGQAYPYGSQPTGQSLAFQPPGFPVFAAVFIAAWDGVTGERGASGPLTLAGYGAVAVVVLAGCRLVRAGPGGRRRELWFLLALAVNPFFREALGDYFHPEDVLALGLLLLTLCLASEGRWWWAGASLGLAIGCKQSALLALPALLLMAPGRQAKSRLLGSTLGAAAVLYLPFVLLTPGSALQIVRGPLPVPGGLVPQTTVIGMFREAPFHVSLTLVNDLARALPLLLAVVVAGLWALAMFRRNGALAPASVEQVVGLIIASVAFRLVGDCIALSYYAVPLVVLIAVVDAWRSRFPFFAIISSFVLAGWYGTHTSTHFLGPWAGALLFTLLVAAVLAGALTTLLPITPAIGAEPRRRTRIAALQPTELTSSGALVSSAVDR
jgi:Glycosyltransferase family 87